MDSTSHSGLKQKQRENAENAVQSGSNRGDRGNRVRRAGSETSDSLRSYAVRHRRLFEYFFAAQPV